ncbi:MAG: carbohydrate-binding domain-containing protein [Clostridia bacterium]|nr:carbohydrate-binding domain-containing protein [Clostridia bacterium]
MKKTLAFSVALLTAASLLASCQGGDLPPSEPNGGEVVGTETAAPVNEAGMAFSFTDREKSGSYEEASATVIVLSDGGSTVTGVGAKADGGRVTVTAGGTYLLSGVLTDGSVTVSAGENDKVQLVLAGVDIACESGPALYIAEADKVFLTLKEGSENRLSDGQDYLATDGDSTLDAALFSRADLAINGKGSLAVTGNYKHGIVSKDDLVITGGAITVTSQKVGLNGKDCVKIGGGTLVIDAGSDGIRSDNKEDESRGYVYIADGDLTVTAGNDGVQAQTVLRVEGGRLSLLTGGGSENASTTPGGGMNPGWGGDWGRPGGGGRPDGGRPGDMGGFGGAVGAEGSIEDADTVSDSAKGLKSYSILSILGGEITVDSSDDSLHSNGSIEIRDGTLSLRSGDDGAHANNTLTVSGGTITVAKSYEGLESTDVTIAGGVISLTASDDGLNAAGGNDGSALGGRPGMGAFGGSAGKITVTGGTLYIKASGDGLDANGTLSITGGDIVVSGANSGDTAILDFDATGTIGGGIFVGTGASGMNQNFSASSSQGVIMLSVGGQSAGTEITLTDEDTNKVLRPIDASRWAIFIAIHVFPVPAPPRT